jgi:hypothetical protein
VDLQLLLRVLWRFRVLVVGGLLLATLLAAFSYVKFNPSGDPKFTPRETEQWEALSTLFVTSRGFPWGSIGTGADPTDPVQPEADEGKTPKGLDPVHLTGLASLYVRLATSDPVLQRMTREGPIEGALNAFPVSSDDTGRGTLLPMVTLSAIAAGPEEALALAKRHSKAFADFIETRQQEGQIPPEDRVVVEVVRHPQEAELLQGRKKTRPMIVFVAVMIVVLGVVLALENLRPRVRSYPPHPEGLEALPSAVSVESIETERSRRSA